MLGEIFYKFCNGKKHLYDMICNFFNTLIKSLLCIHFLACVWMFLSKNHFHNILSSVRNLYPEHSSWVIKKYSIHNDISI